MNESKPQNQPILEVKHLRLVRALVDQGGPTRAGKYLNLSQSAVSHQLADLESRLGITLFARVKRKLQPTAAGRQLLEFSRSAIRDFEQIETTLRQRASNAQRRMRLCTECFTGYHWLPSVLPTFSREFPEVDVRIEIAATRKPLAALRKNRVDLAIMSSAVTDPEFVVDRLFDDEWVVALPLGHSLCERKFVRPADLEPMTVFAHHASAQDAKRLQELLARDQTRIGTLQPIPVTEAIIELVKANLGIALMSRWVASPYLARGDIECRRFTRSGLRETWAAVYRRETENDLPVARFAELLRANSPNIVP